MEEVEYLEEYIEEYPNVIPQILNNSNIDEFLPVNENGSFDLFSLNTNFDEFIQEDSLVKRYPNDFQNTSCTEVHEEMTTYSDPIGTFRNIETADSSTHKESYKNLINYSNFQPNDSSNNSTESSVKIISCKTIDTSAIRNRSFPFNSAPIANSIHATRKSNLIQVTKSTKFLGQHKPKSLFGSYTKLNLNRQLDPSLNRIVAIKKPNSTFNGKSKLPKLRGTTNIFGSFNEKIIKYKKENPELFPIKEAEVPKSAPKITAKPSANSIFVNKNNRSFIVKSKKCPLFKPNINVKKFSKYASKSVPSFDMSSESLDKDNSILTEDEIDGSEAVEEEIVKTNDGTQNDDSDKDSFDGLVETLNEYIDDESHNDQIEDNPDSPDKCSSNAMKSQQTIKLDIQPNIIDQGTHYIKLNDSPELKNQNKNHHENKYEGNKNKKKQMYSGENINKETHVINEKEKIVDLNKDNSVKKTQQISKNSRSKTQRKTTETFVIKIGEERKSEKELTNNKPIIISDIKIPMKSSSISRRKSLSAVNKVKKTTSSDDKHTKTESISKKASLKKNEESKLDNIEIKVVQKDKDQSEIHSKSNEKDISEHIENFTQEKITLRKRSFSQYVEKSIESNQDSDKSLESNKNLEQSVDSVQNIINEKDIQEAITTIIEIPNSNISDNRDELKSDQVEKSTEVVDSQNLVAESNSITESITKIEKEIEVVKEKDNDNISKTVITETINTIINNTTLSAETTLDEIAECKSKQGNISEESNKNQLKKVEQKINLPVKNSIQNMSKIKLSLDNTEEKNGNLDDVDAIDNFLAEIDSVMKSIHSDEIVCKELNKTNNLNSIIEKNETCNSEIEQNDNSNLDAILIENDNTEMNENIVSKVKNSSKNVKENISSVSESSVSVSRTTRLKSKEKPPKELSKVNVQMIENKKDDKIKEDILLESSVSNNVKICQRKRSVNSEENPNKKIDDFEKNLSKNKLTKVRFDNIRSPKIILVKADKIIAARSNCVQNVTTEKLEVENKSIPKLKKESVAAIVHLPKTRKQSKDETNLEKDKTKSENKVENETDIICKLKNLLEDNKTNKDVEKSEVKEVKSFMKNSDLSNSNIEIEITKDDNKTTTENSAQTLKNLDDNKKDMSSKIKANLKSDIENDHESNEDSSNLSTKQNISVNTEICDKNSDNLSDQEVENIMTKKIESITKDSTIRNNSKETRMGRQRNKRNSSSSDSKKSNKIPIDNSSIDLLISEINAKRRKVEQELKFNAEQEEERNKNKSIDSFEHGNEEVSSTKEDNTSIKTMSGKEDNKSSDFDILLSPLHQSDFKNQSCSSDKNEKSITESKGTKRKATKNKFNKYEKSEKIVKNENTDSNQVPDPNTPTKTNKKVMENKGGMDASQVETIENRKYKKKIKENSIEQLSSESLKNSTTNSEIFDTTINSCNSPSFSSDSPYPELLYSFSDQSYQMQGKRKRKTNILASNLSDSMLKPKSENRRDRSKNILTPRSDFSFENLEMKTFKNANILTSPRSAKIIRRRQSNLIQVTRKEYEKVLNENRLKKEKLIATKRCKNILRDHGITKCIKIKVKRMSLQTIKSCIQLTTKKDQNKLSKSFEIEKSKIEERNSLKKDVKIKAVVDEEYIPPQNVIAKEKQKVKVKKIDEMKMNTNESVSKTIANVKFENNDSSIFSRVSSPKSTLRETPNINNDNLENSNKLKVGVTAVIPINDRISRRDIDRRTDKYSKRLTRARSVPRNAIHLQNEVINDDSVLQKNKSRPSAANLRNENDDEDTDIKSRSLISKIPASHIKNSNNKEILDDNQNSGSPTSKTKKGFTGNFDKKINNATKLIKTSILSQTIPKENSKETDSIGLKKINQNKNIESSSNVIKDNKVYKNIKGNKNENKKNIKKENKKNIKKENKKNMKKENKKSNKKENKKKLLSKADNKNETNVKLSDKNWISTSENILIENEIELQQENPIEKILTTSDKKSDSVLVSTIVPLEQLKSPKTSIILSNESIAQNKQIQSKIKTTVVPQQQNHSVKLLPEHVIVETVFMTREEFDRKQNLNKITPTTLSKSITQVKAKTTKQSSNNRDVENVLSKISDLLENQIKHESQMKLNEIEKLRRKAQRLNNVTKMKFNSDNALQVLVFLQNYFFNVQSQDTNCRKQYNLLANPNEPSTSSSSVSATPSTLITSTDSEKYFPFKKIRLQKQPVLEHNSINVTNNNIMRIIKQKSLQIQDPNLTTSKVVNKRSGINSSTISTNIQSSAKTLKSDKQLQLLSSSSNLNQVNLMVAERSEIIEKEPEEILPDLANVVVPPPQIKLETETPDDVII